MDTESLPLPPIKCGDGRRAEPHSQYFMLNTVKKNNKKTLKICPHKIILTLYGPIFFFSSIFGTRPKERLMGATLIGKFFDDPFLK